MIARTLVCLLLAIALGWPVPSPAQAQPPEVRPLVADVDAFIRYMVEAHGFDEQALRQILASVKPSAGVQKAIAAPSTAKPWFEFRPLFVDRDRIEHGVKFWAEHADVLARARERFDVPEAIVVSIIGIETRYGRTTGRFPILDALYTLAFASDRRPDFFRGELEQFLLLAREQNWDPTKVKGSYAGAMGLPQFMPSSYRRYAIDFNDDGAIDLWSDYADVIGSVASYLQRFGWKYGDPVVASVIVDGDPDPLVGLGLVPEFTVRQWRMRGVETRAAVADNLPAALFRLDLADGAQFMLGFENFHTLLYYNRSRHYAMAVYELANEIEQARERPPVADARRAAGRGALALAGQNHRISGKRNRYAAHRRARRVASLERG